MKTCKMHSKKKYLKPYFVVFIISVLALLVSVLSAFAGQKVYFYHTDAAGTPVAMTDASGNVVWRADYKPFGEEQSVTQDPENNVKFVGKEKDKETGLYYFGARYMDAKTGRFTSPDPVGIRESDLLNPQKFNRYNYSLNNPYRYIDPDGNTVWDIADFAFFGHSLYKFTKDPSWSNAGDLGLDAIGLLPVIPSLGTIKRVGEGLSKIDKMIDTSKTVRESIHLADGIKMSTNNALETAATFLGEGYKDMGKGRFVSADGLRQVRIGDADILGKHGSGPHVNFEQLRPNASNPNKMEVYEKKHIYIED